MQNVSIGSVMNIMVFASCLTALPGRATKTGVYPHRYMTNVGIGINVAFVQKSYKKFIQNRGGKHDGTFVFFNYHEFFFEKKE